MPALDEVDVVQRKQHLPDDTVSGELVKVFHQHLQRAQLRLHVRDLEGEVLAPLRTLRLPLNGGLLRVLLVGQQRDLAVGVGVRHVLLVLVHAVRRRQVLGLDDLDHQHLGGDLVLQPEVQLPQLVLRQLFLVRQARLFGLRLVQVSLQVLHADLALAGETTPRARLNALPVGRPELDGLHVDDRGDVPLAAAADADVVGADVARGGHGVCARVVVAVDAVPAHALDGLRAAAGGVQALLLGGGLGGDDGVADVETLGRGLLLLQLLLLFLVLPAPAAVAAASALAWQRLCHLLQDHARLRTETRFHSHWSQWL